MLIFFWFFSLGMLIKFMLIKKRVYETWNYSADNIAWHTLHCLWLLLLKSEGRLKKMSITLRLEYSCRKITSILLFNPFQSEVSKPVMFYILWFSSKHITKINQLTICGSGRKKSVSNKISSLYISTINFILWPLPCLCLNQKGRENTRRWSWLLHNMFLKKE